MKSKIIFFAALLLIGCSQLKYLNRHPEICTLCKVGDTTIINNSVSEKDTAFSPDSIYLRAWLECDSNYNIYLKYFQGESDRYKNISVNMQDSILSLNILLKGCAGKVITNVRTVEKKVTIENPVNIVLKNENAQLKSDLLRMQSKYVIVQERSKKWAKWCILGWSIVAGFILLVVLKFLGKLKI